MSCRTTAIRILTAILLAITPLPLLAAESSGTVLITGANRGIGLALAERFGKAGYTVIGTARTPEKAAALEASGARVEKLDVASQESVDALAARLGGIPIDIVVNNAGIGGHDAEKLADLEVDRLDEVLKVNSLGPLRVTQALMPNVEKSPSGIVANISSMMGSMEMNSWGCCLGYRASKAALNSMTVTLALDYGSENLIFVTLHPGYVKTDMNEGRGNITPRESADGLFRVITGLKAADNGKFYDFQGKELPW